MQIFQQEMDAMAASVWMKNAFSLLNVAIRFCINPLKCVSKSLYFTSINHLNINVSLCQDYTVFRIYLRSVMPSSNCSFALVGKRKILTGFSGCVSSIHMWQC